VTLEGMVVVREMLDRLDAETVAAFLRAQGIEATVSSDDAGGVLPALEEGTGVQVLVRKGDEAGARRVLREQEAETAEDPKD
jgi:hypothetical protein